jgi:hypothetical protein
LSYGDSHHTGSCGGEHDHPESDWMTLDVPGLVVAGYLSHLLYLPSTLIDRFVFFLSTYPIELYSEKLFQTLLY